MSMMVLPWVIVGTVFGGLLIIATVVGAVLFASGQPGSGVRRVGGSLVLVCGGLLAAAMFTGISLTIIRHETATELRRVDQAHTVQTQQAMEQRDIARATVIRQETTAAHQPDAGLTRLPNEDPAASPADALTPLTGHDDRTAVARDSASLPQWASVSLLKEGDVTRLVLSSQQFATVEEARQDVAKATRAQLLADFQKTFGTSAAMLRKLPDETLRSLAVRHEFVETVDRDFGSFFAPMHRVWWQVELSPAVRSELYPVWRSKEQEIRTLVVAGNLVLATLGLAMLSWFTRRKPLVQTPQPQSASTNPIVLGVGAATLLAKRCRRWWG